VSSIRELADITQRSFWAVNMGRPPAYDPIRETEYLLQGGLDAAEQDGTLRFVASTYDAQRDRLLPGAGVKGLRVLDFAPLLGLREWLLNDAIRLLLAACERATDAPVEIEFAITLHEDTGQARIGFVQVRPMMRTAAQVDVAPDDLTQPGVLVASRFVMGNGAIEQIHDVVYVRPDRFEPRHSRQVAIDVAALNATLVDQRVPYVLIGFGRWGSSDPWLGIQVTWAQIAGARVIAEASLPGFQVELSQGSHFFHNISSHGVSYFSVAGDGRIDWAWLDTQPAVRETTFVRHVRTDMPLLVKVDGRSGRGVIQRSVP
jgi:hypothetical protein